MNAKLYKTGKAKLIFVDYSWLGDDSDSAAQAAHCAGDQNMYHEYHSALYTNQGGINDGWASAEELKGFAESLGLDLETFSECLDSGNYASKVMHNTEVGTANEVAGTPAFFLISGDELKRIDGPQPTSVFLGVINEFGTDY